ncbi:hypothetical protein BGC_33010 [Burkholderia sp. 3C]
MPMPSASNGETSRSSRKVWRARVKPAVARRGKSLKDMNQKCQAGTRRECGAAEAIVVMRLRTRTQAASTAVADWAESGPPSVPERYYKTFRATAGNPCMPGDPPWRAAPYRPDVIRTGRRMILEKPPKNGSENYVKASP